MGKDNQKLSFMKEKTLKKYINTTHGVLTILELDHELYDSKKQQKRSYFLCKCNRCNSLTIVRVDRFSGSKYLPKSCTNCIIDLQKEIAEKKYLIKDTKSARLRLHSIKNNARIRKFNMELTDKEIKEFLTKPCYYCNIPNANGIDRVNSKKHYDKDNCVPCCFICNRMKNKYNLDIFLDKVEKIYNNFHKKSSTTISKESTLQAYGNGSGELLTI